MFSTQKLPIQFINVLHNITDTIINISKAEGFGLSTLISMMAGKPIITLCTGGETRQAIDWRDGTPNGVAIQPASRQLVGSQLVPYIYEDFSAHKDVVDAFMKIYEMTDEEKEQMKQKVLDYVDFEFNYDKMVKDWDTTLETCIQNFKANSSKYWSVDEVKNRKVLAKIASDSKNNTNPKEEGNIDITANILKNVKITKQEGNK